MKVKTIGASGAAYDLVMDKKQEMERLNKKSVSMGQALDALLEERMEGGNE